MGNRALTQPDAASSDGVSSKGLCSSGTTHLQTVRDSVSGRTEAAVRSPPFTSSGFLVLSYLDDQHFCESMSNLCYERAELKMFCC